MAAMVTAGCVVQSSVKVQIEFVNTVIATFVNEKISAPGWVSLSHRWSPDM